MYWRQAAGMVSQRRVEKAMGEALGCSQRADGRPLERVLEVCPSDFTGLLYAADLGYSAVLALTLRRGRPGLWSSVNLRSASSVTVCNACRPS